MTQVSRSPGIRATTFPAPALAGSAAPSSPASTPSSRSSPSTASATARSKPVGLASSHSRMKRSNIRWSSATANRLCAPASLLRLASRERIGLKPISREEAMPETPDWRLTGDWFDVCRCRVPCGCTFAQAPDEGQCDGILAWHVREGSYGDVALDGLNIVGVGSFEGNIWTGEAVNPAMGFFIDERADERQREALRAIWSGEAGGWPAGFAQLITDVRGFEAAPIEFEIADDLGAWRVEVPGRAKGSADALTGPTAPEGARVQVHN